MMLLLKSWPSVSLLSAACRAFGAAVAVSGLLAGPALAARSPARPIAPAQLEQFVDGVIADGMATRHVAGVTVSVVQGGKVVLVKGYGMARPGHAVDAERDLFRIASISKTFTWIALMREVERGRIKLEAPVNDYLPAELRIRDDGLRRPVRIADLMSHAAGFDVADRTHLAVDQPARVISLAEELRRHQPRRVREPGVLSSYSNYGAALAGYIVARSQGLEFDDLIDRDLTGPLGMTSTTFREPYPARRGLPAPMPAALARRLATGFAWKGGEYRPDGFEFISQNGPAGSVSTTAPDMARYMLMQLAGGTLDGRRVYGPQAAQALRTPIMKTPEGVNGWAHGLMIRTLPGGYLSYGHGGSLERFFSNMSLIPDLDLGVFVSTNTSTGRGLAESLPKLIVARFYAPPPIDPDRPGDPGLAKDAGIYAGRYITTRRAYGGLEKFADLLESHDRVSVTPKGKLVTMLSGEVRTWVPDGRPGHFIDAHGVEKLVFDRDAKGRMTGFPFPRGTYTAERAGPLLDEGVFRISAALAMLAAAVGWIGAALRRGRGARPTRWQARTGALNLTVSALWLLAFAALWRSGLLTGEDPESHFPGAALLAASWSALLAAIGALALVPAFVLALRDPPDGEGGWDTWRMAGQGLAIAAFLLFSLELWVWGALTPWA